MTTQSTTVGKIGGLPWMPVEATGIPYELGWRDSYVKSFNGIDVAISVIVEESGEGKILFSAFEKENGIRFAWGISRISKDGEFEHDSVHLHSEDRNRKPLADKYQNSRLLAVIHAFHNDTEKFNGVNPDHRAMIWEAFSYLRSFVS